MEEFSGIGATSCWGFGKHKSEPTEKPVGMGPSRSPKKPTVRCLRREKRICLRLWMKEESEAPRELSFPNCTSPSFPGANLLRQKQLGTEGGEGLMKVNRKASRKWPCDLAPHVMKQLLFTRKGESPLPKSVATSVIQPHPLRDNWNIKSQSRRACQLLLKCP